MTRRKSCDSTPSHSPLEGPPGSKTRHQASSAPNMHHQWPTTGSLQSSPLSSTSALSIPWWLIGSGMLGVAIWQQDRSLQCIGFLWGFLLADVSHPTLMATATNATIDIVWAMSQCYTQPAKVQSQFIWLCCSTLEARYPLPDSMHQHCWPYKVFYTHK